MPDIDQINISVTDTIPPENFATIDKNSLVGTVYTKAQDNEWREEVESMVQSGIKGVAKPNTPYDPITNPYPTPWVTGNSPLYEKYDVSLPGAYMNFRDVNDEDIVVTQSDLDLNEVQIWVKNGVSEKVLKAMPQASVNIRKWEDLQTSDFPLNEGSQVIFENNIWIVKDGKSVLNTDLPNTNSLVWEIVGVKDVVNNITNITQEIIVDPSQIVPTEAQYNNGVFAVNVAKRIDRYSDLDVNYKKTTTWFDGTAMTDAKIDSDIFIKIGTEYYVRKIDDHIDINWLGAKGDGVNNDAIAINKALLFAYRLGVKDVIVKKPISKYLISSPLVVYSNTNLIIDPSAELYLANGVNDIMIGNANKSTVGNITIIDENITITGGIWNGNRLNQSKWKGADGVTNLVTISLFSGVRNLKILNCKIRNSRTYGMLCSNIEGFEFDNIDMDVFTGIQDNGDGIHLLGLCKYGRITNSTVKSDDNFIALNADDVPHGPHGLFGKIEKVYINNITVNNNKDGQGMRLLSGVSPIHDITISNIKGSAAYFCVCSTLNIGVGDFDNISIENITLKQHMNSWNYFSMVGNFGNVSIKNVFIDTDAVQLTTSVIDRFFYIYSEGSNTPNTTVKRLTMDNINVSNLNAGSGIANMNVLLINNNATVDSLILESLTCKNNIKPTRIISVVAGSVINKLYTSDLDIDYTNNTFMVTTGGTVNRHYIDGVYSATFTPIIKGSSTAGTGTYTVQKGLFTYGGGRVNFELQVDWTAHDGVGQICIDLPKAVKTTSIDYSPCGVYKSGITLAAGEFLKCLIYRPSSRLQLYKETSTSLSPLLMMSSGSLSICGNYPTIV